MKPHELVAMAQALAQALPPDADVDVAINVYSERSPRGTASSPKIVTTTTHARPVMGRGSRGGLTNAQKCAAYRARRAATPPDPVSTPSAAQVSGSGSDPIRDPSTSLVTPGPTPIDTTSTPDLFQSGSSSSGSGCSEKTTTTGSGEGATPRPTPEPDPSLEEFARSLLAGDADPTETRPQERIEFRVALEQFRHATGYDHVTLGAWPDANTKRLVELFARPFTPEQLGKAFEFLPRSTWWKDVDHRSHGLAGLSVRVVERILTEANEAARKPSRPGPAVVKSAPVIVASVDEIDGYAETFHRLAGGKVASG